MKDERGAPAFDNVDDLLADRIVTHSKRHSEHPKRPASESAAGRQPSEPAPEENDAGTSTPLFVASAVVLLAVLFLLYRLLDRPHS